MKPAILCSAIILAALAAWKLHRDTRTWKSWPYALPETDGLQEPYRWEVG